MDPHKRHPWEHLTLDEVRRTLATNITAGLTGEEVARRLTIYGPNLLEHTKEDGLFSKGLQQFKNPLMLILLLAGVITLGLQEFLDASVIFIALLINVVVGAFQEERASKAFEKLNASQEARALVFREGKKQNIPAEEVVPGDIILLEGGYHVAADARLVEAKELKLNEAALTGEWMAVEKYPDQLLNETTLAEQHNMAWMGTMVESGYGRAVVVATGVKTQVGVIASELGSVADQTTPLQQNIRHVARFLTYVIGGALAIIFILGLLRGEPTGEMLLIAIAIAVATIPTGLPAAVTVVLAIGMEAILKRGGLVRNLLAAETLGTTTIILTDKTGTLTEARMKLTSLHTFDAIQKKRSDIDAPGCRFLLELGVMTSDAFVEEAADAPRKLTVHGRPIEKAVVVAGLETGIAQDETLRHFPRIDYLQFTSEQRFGASLHESEARKTRRLVVIGAPELLLEEATSLYTGGKKEKFTDRARKKLLEHMESLGAEGIRVIAAGYRDVPWDEIPEEESKERELLQTLTFVGFLAFADPVREDVPAAIEEVRGAGAQVIMLTGDNPATARSIARQAGIVIEADELVIHGNELDEWSDDELYAKLQEARVIARALPSHKLRIARIFKKNGEVVAMTGDGINDAPALRAASIGVAVGAGTEVAKEASDMVLIDNSFSIIVAAIEEGRRILDNLKKIVAYLLSTSFSEVFLIGGALVAGAPLPLLPAQILWANIVEEGLMSFSFAFEPKGKRVMKRNPRSDDAKKIVTPELRKLIVIVSAVTGVLTIGIYFMLLRAGLPIEEVRTMMFAVLSLDAIFFTFSMKSLDTPLWRINLFSNTYLLVALGTSVLLLVGALSLSPLQTLLSLVPLTPLEILLLIGVGIFNLFTIEVAKYFFFERPLSRDDE